MNTPAHVIFSLSLLGKKNAVNYTNAIVLGAVLPDAAMFVFYVYQKIIGVPEKIIWESHYFQTFWQNLFDIFNSLPLLIIALAIMYFKQKKYFVLLFASMIIHCLLDFPVHHDDGHRHLFPLSDFRFQSPVSYWDPAHFGGIVSVIEAILFMAGSIFLWQIDKGKVSTVWPLTHLRKVVLLTTVVYFGFFIFVFTNWV